MLSLLLFTAISASLPAGQEDLQDCNTPAAAHIPSSMYLFPVVRSHPSPLPDGCWVFVALLQGETGIAVISRQNGAVSLERTVPVRAEGWGPAGAVLTRDGSTLITAAGNNVAFLDARGLKNGDGEPLLGYLHVGRGAGAIYVNVTPDDRTLFVALERARAILVVDLDGFRRGGGFHVPVPLGRVPVGNAPIAVALSNDGRFLYTTSQSAHPDWGVGRRVQSRGQPEWRAVIILAAPSWSSIRHERERTLAARSSRRCQ